MIIDLFSFIEINQGQNEIVNQIGQIRFGTFYIFRTTATAQYNLCQC